MAGGQRPGVRDARLLAGRAGSDDLGEVDPPGGRPRGVARFDRLLAGEICRYWIDKRYIRKDGSVLWALLSVNSVRRVRGEGPVVVAILTDIGPRKKDEEALRESEARMARVLGRERRRIRGLRGGDRLVIVAPATAESTPAGRDEEVSVEALLARWIRRSPGHPGRHGRHRRGREGLPPVGLPDPPGGRNRALDPEPGQGGGSRPLRGPVTSPGPSPTSPPGSSSRRSGNGCSWNCRGPSSR